MHDGFFGENHRLKGVRDDSKDRKAGSYQQLSETKTPGSLILTNMPEPIRAKVRRNQCRCTSLAKAMAEDPKVRA